MAGEAGSMKQHIRKLRQRIRAAMIAFKRGYIIQSIAMYYIPDPRTKLKKLCLFDLPTGFIPLDGSPFLYDQSVSINGQLLITVFPADQAIEFI